jgi:DNA-binding PucR family transcriptional regulator
LIVHRDDRLLSALQDQVLAPLAEQPAGARQRLEETLVAWLTHMGDHRAIAAALHVHPQTVRYRLARLRALFGAALEDPHTRLRLTLALCWRNGS